jgi:hypothetical protein
MIIKVKGIPLFYTFILVTNSFMSNCLQLEYRWAQNDIIKQMI